MVHYIRFLKPPSLQKLDSRNHRISALITITTDLGDAFCTKAVALSASVNPIVGTLAKGRIKRTFQWTATSRVLAINIDVVRSQLQLPATLCVSNIGTDSEDVLSFSSLPGIISAWSAPFDDFKAQKADYFVERRFKMPDAGPLCIWEETGDSIARHIWDSGPLFLAYLNKVRHHQDSIFFDPSQKSTPLKIIELGSGCGIVGIGLANIVCNSDILLTDLPEAQDILARNVDCSIPAMSSKISCCVLDWEDDLPTIVTKREHDVILVSDCTYNTDTIPALVSTLSKLSSTSPKAVIYLATKVRHSSEAEFFALMDDARYITNKLDQIDLPTYAFDQDETQEKVEIYIFRKD